MKRETPKSKRNPYLRSIDRKGRAQNPRSESSDTQLQLHQRISKLSSNFEEMGITEAESKEEKPRDLTEIRGIVEETEKRSGF